MKIYIGYDPRETRAYAVTRGTAERFACNTEPIYEERLRACGMLTRPVDRRDRMWDLNSSAPQSTEFAISRFFVPLLAHSGWCLFVDCDMVFLQDPHELLACADEKKAVCVVKHPPLTFVDNSKMDNQIQTAYSRKLWSSVVLWNMEHPAHRRLNLTTLNQWPGRDLHAFRWLSDDEIGELPAEANWLVGLQPKPVRPIIAHYTLGTPNIPGLNDSEHAEIWFAAERSLYAGSGKSANMNLTEHS